MDEEPLVAVIIVNWNGRELTLECLASVRTLRYPRIVTLVVDNGSTDGSADAIRSAFPEVDVLRIPHNLGFAGGTNAGIRRVLERGPAFVLLLNNDTIIGEDCVAKLVERSRRERGIGIAAPKIYYHSEPGRIWYAGGNIDWWRGVTWHTGIRERDVGQYDTARETDFATGCCMLVSTDVIRTVGLLDEGYRMYSEDADWCVRARKAGYRTVYEPAAVLWHKVSASSGGNLSWFKLKRKLVSSMRFFALHAAWYHWLVFPWMSLLINARLLLVRAAESGQRR